MRIDLFVKMNGDRSVILVTGGSGLVGQAIKAVVEQECPNASVDNDKENWIFCSSKDADLRYAGKIIFINTFCKYTLFTVYTGV